MTKKQHFLVAAAAGTAMLASFSAEAFFGPFSFMNFWGPGWGGWGGPWSGWGYPYYGGWGYPYYGWGGYPYYGGWGYPYAYGYPFAAPVVVTKPATTADK